MFSIALNFKELVISLQPYDVSGLRWDLDQKVAFKGFKMDMCLNGSLLAKLKRVFLSCYCHEVYRVEACSWSKKLQ